MEIRVEYQEGLGGEPEPAVVWFGERRLAVQAITDRWYGTDRRWWKLQTEDGLYVLRRDDAQRGVGVGGGGAQLVAGAAPGRRPTSQLADVDLEDVGKARLQARYWESFHEAASAFSLFLHQLSRLCSFKAGK